MSKIFNPGAAPKLAIKLETRNLADPIGDAAYTGYGFTPEGLIIICGGAGNGSVGSSEKGLIESCVYGDGSTPFFEDDTAIVRAALSASMWSKAVLKTYDVDGFTLTWSKGSTPSGMVTLQVFAFKE